MAVCAQPGCPTIVRKGRCATHTAQAYQRYNKRGKGKADPYGWDWQQFRDAMQDMLCSPGVYRAGLCGATLATATGDSLCAAVGDMVRWRVLDHVVPITGVDDPSRLDPLAVQGLCDLCHQRKRQTEWSGTGEATNRGAADPPTGGRT